MKKKEFLTEAKRKQIVADKEKAIIENFGKTFNKIKRVDENILNEIGGPIPNADVRITYVGAPNNVDEDKIDRCVSEIKQKVTETLKDVFNVPINLVKVSFNDQFYK
jgi:hypothetical protein